MIKKTRRKKGWLGPVGCLVVKVGTSSLTYEDGHLDSSAVKRLVSQIANLHKEGWQVILVSSGAVGAGIGKLGWKKPLTIREKQAAASVGQGVLLHTYEEFFSGYECLVGQILLTREDFRDRRRYLNARNTFEILLDARVVPIVNENDTVAVEEIRWGDNDNLAAQVAGMLNAEMLVILTDAPGLLTGDPNLNPQAQLVPIVHEINSEVSRMAGRHGSRLGTGGMATKIQAARTATSFGIPTVIADSREEGVLAALVAGTRVGTLFLPWKAGVHGKKRWLAFSASAHGKVIIDEGACKALLEDNKSLLSSGIVGVEGVFDEGDVISIVTMDNLEIARGICTYSAADLDKVKGRRSNEATDILGRPVVAEVVHRNNLAIKA